MELAIFLQKKGSETREKECHDADTKRGKGSKQEWTPGEHELSEAQRQGLPLTAKRSTRPLGKMSRAVITTRVTSQMRRGEYNRLPITPARFPGASPRKKDGATKHRGGWRGGEVEGDGSSGVAEHMTVNVLGKLNVRGIKSFLSPHFNYAPAHPKLPFFTNLLPSSRSSKLDEFIFLWRSSFLTTSYQCRN